MASSTEEKEGFQLKRVFIQDRHTLIHGRILCGQLEPIGNGFEDLTPLPNARPRLFDLV